MTRMLGATGRRALRVLAVGLDPDDRAGLADGLAPVLDRIAQNYPDRVPLVTGVLSHAPSRDALLIAARLELPVRLLVSGNVQRLIDGLPAGQREALCDLVRNADSIVALAKAEDAPGAIRKDADMLLAAGPIADVACPVVVLNTAGAIVDSPWRR
jgi:hypothetical protein